VCTVTYDQFNASLIKKKVLTNYILFNRMYTHFNTISCQDWLSFFCAGKRRKPFVSVRPLPVCSVWVTLTFPPALLRHTVFNKRQCLDRTLLLLLYRSACCWGLCCFSSLVERRLFTLLFSEDREARREGIVLQAVFTDPVWILNSHTGVFSFILL